jgi:cytochrome P450
LFDAQTIVSICSLAGNKLGWHRAEEFMPERFLATRAPEFEEDPRGAFQPFSMGTRNCIGRNLAFVELRMILTKLLWHFDVELLEAETGDFLKDQKVYAIWHKKPVYVKLVAIQR